jgi:protein TonB
MVTLPTHIPSRPVIIEDPPDFVSGSGAVPGGVPGGMPGGTPGGLPAGIADAVNHFVPVLKPPVPVLVIAEPPKAPPPPQRVSWVRMANPIHRVEPVYPRIAIDAHISGTVELQGVLGVDGRIHELKVLRGHPFLIKAAVDAVLQWTYEPAMLNGQPVEVQAPIQVNFVLSR